MKSDAVSLQVMAGVPVDCSFWPEDDGWSGVCEKLSVIVRGSSFEDAKKNMEAALQEHIEASCENSWDAVHSGSLREARFHNASQF